MAIIAAKFQRKKKPGIFFKKIRTKIWQQQKNNQIFATQNKNMLRKQLHIESVNWCSPEKGLAICGTRKTIE